jgi:hypothetical protein
MKNKTIYVSMATMDDTETTVSLQNLFNSADFPDRVFVGLSCISKNKKFIKSIDSLKNKYKISVKHFTPDASILGTGFGRFNAMSMYSDQDYFLQVDSHTNFENGWDTYLINLFEDAAKEVGNEKIVLTAYLGRYGYLPERSPIESATRYPYYKPGELFDDVYPSWMDAVVTHLPEKFYPCVKFNGNFAFGNKNFANNTGVVKEAQFFDEEILQSINLIGNGFSMVFPNIAEFPLTHLYYNDANNFGGKRNNMSDYVKEKVMNQITNHKKMLYYLFLEDEKNLEAIKSYQEYARINMKLGAIKKYYIPSYYNKEENL